MPEKVHMLTTWYGKPVEELSREELLDVIDHFAKHYDETTWVRICEKDGLDPSETMADNWAEWGGRRSSEHTESAFLPR